MAIKAMVSQYESGQHVPGESGNNFPSREEIKKYLEGNLCRCTGYVKIVDSAEKLFSN